MAVTSSLADTYTGMIHGIELARNSLKEVLKRVSDYDAQFVGVGEKAGPYVKSAVDVGQTALDELARIVESLKSGTTEIPIKALSLALARFNAAFTHLMDVATEYDTKYALKTRLSTVVAHPGEQATAAVATVGAYAAAAAASVNAQLQGVADALNSTKTKCLEVRPADVGAIIVEKAKELDERFGLSGMLTQYAVTPAQSLDQKVTGGKVSQAVISAYTAGWNMVYKFQEKLQSKK